MSTIQKIALLATLAIAAPLAAQEPVLWIDRSNGGDFVCNPSTGLRRNLNDNDNWSQRAETFNDTLCDPPTFTLPSNWSTGTFPSSPTVTVSLGALPGGSGQSTFLDVHASVGTLLVGPANTLQWSNSVTLTVQDGITNDGLIVLVPGTGGGTAILQIAGDVLLGGSGTTTLQNARIGSSANVIESTSASEVLTIGPDQTVTSIVNGTGAAFVRAALVNEGTINANGSADLRFETFDKINRGILRAGPGGCIDILGVTIDNTVGSIELPATDSDLQLRSAIINGGTISGEGTLFTDNTLSTLVGPLTIGSGVTARAGANNSPGTLALQGTVTNDGTLAVVPRSGNSTLRVLGNVLLDGSGSVSLRRATNGGGAPVIDSAAPTDVLTIGPDQTVETPSDSPASFVSTALVNEGTFRVSSGADLNFTTHPKTNNGVFRAEGGGDIVIVGISVDNTSGSIELVDAGSGLSLQNATINGGTISGEGTLVTDNTLSTLVGPLTIGSGVTARAGANNSRGTLALQGTITNDGTLAVAPISGNSTLRVLGNVLLDGSGTVSLLRSPRSGGVSIIDSATPTDVLTVGPDQTVDTAPDSPASVVSTALVNEGTFRVSGNADLNLNTHPKTNNGVIRAEDAGSIVITGISVDNTSGSIEITDASSELRLTNATIRGGTISGTGLILQPGGTDTSILAGPIALESGVRSVTTQNRTLAVEGSITNHGTLFLDGFSNQAATLRIGGDVTLDGTGAVRCRNRGFNRITSAAPEDLLINGPGHAILATPVGGESGTSFGMFISARLDNQGLVEASTSSSAIALDQLDPPRKAVWTRDFLGFLGEAVGFLDSGGLRVGCGGLLKGFGGLGRGF